MNFIIGVAALILIAIFGLIIRYYPKKFFSNDLLIYYAIELMLITGLYFIMLHYSVGTNNLLIALLLTLITLVSMFWRIRKILYLVNKNSSGENA